MPTPGAHLVIELIEPGVIAWSRERGYEGVHEDGSQVEPVGGVVLDSWEAPNAETGEIERWFKVLDPHRTDRTRPGGFVWHVLREAEIDRETLDVAPPGMLAGLYFRLGEYIGTKGPGKRRRGLATPDLLEAGVHLGRIRKLLVIT